MTRQVESDQARSVHAAEAARMVEIATSVPFLTGESATLTEMKYLQSQTAWENALERLDDLQLQLTELASALQGAQYEHGTAEDAFGNRELEAFEFVDELDEMELAQAPRWVIEELTTRKIAADDRTADAREKLANINFTIKHLPAVISNTEYDIVEARAVLDASHQALSSARQ
jgi:hypothetical protein